VLLAAFTARRAFHLVLLDRRACWRRQAIRIWRTRRKADAIGKRSLLEGPSPGLSRAAALGSVFYGSDSRVNCFPFYATTAGSAGDTHIRPVDTLGIPSVPYLFVDTRLLEKRRPVESTRTASGHGAEQVKHSRPGSGRDGGEANLAALLGLQMKVHRCRMR
jgi:hypothetical protein